MNPLLTIDGYKSSHRPMYPKETSLVYSSYICRSTKRMPEQAQDIVVSGIQPMVMYIHKFWENNFFKLPKDKVCGEAKEYLESYLGAPYNVSHFEALHDLGYLPIEIKSLDEGTIINAGVPLFTIKNTHSDFFWLTNFLETSLSTLIWKPVHSASLAYSYKKILTKYALETDERNLGFVDFQGHDFSMRGMQSIEAAISSGMGFLTCFKGTDTIPAIQGIKEYYGDSNAGFSVPASEHSVMCAHGKEGEIDTLLYLMNEFPKGILSVVSDTWDLWKLITEYLPKVKDRILARDGKLVIRPDSGDPVDILCGSFHTIYANSEENSPKYDYPKYGIEKDSPAYKGVIELLWDIFGGTINEQGYKVLNSHIGAIYGDSITLERAEQICERLKQKGFASTNVVLGVGSYSMGYATRDNQGGAIKSSYVEIAGEPREIFKDPVTDDGTKKSKKGLLMVFKDALDGQIKCFDQCSWEDEQDGLLTTVYKDGKITKTVTLAEIRERINFKINKT